MNMHLLDFNSNESFGKLKNKILKSELTKSLITFKKLILPYNRKSLILNVC